MTILVSLLPIVILIANYYFLQYKIYPIIVSIIINNIALYFNFITFWVMLYYRNKDYVIKKKYYTMGIIISIVLLFMYCFIIRTNLFVKPFSDLFGYYVIRNILNKQLNDNKEKKPGFFLSILIFILNIFLFIVSILNKLFTSVRKLINNNYVSPLTDLIDEIKQTINKGKVDAKEYLGNVYDYDNRWDILINSIPFSPGGIHNKKSNKEQNFNIIEKILKYMFDAPVDKYNDKLQNVFNNITLFRDEESQDDIINLLDRKFLVSKIIWLILIIIITQGLYMSLS
jgi:hypothetical protein